MKCKLEKAVDAYDAGPDRVLGLKPLMCRFQDVVAEHSKMSGCGLEWLLDQGRAWVMHRICIRIHQMPVLGETLTFVTWHRGEKGYKAFRDFEVWSGAQKRISASSLWLFMDLHNARILKVPRESRQWYTVETDTAMEPGTDAGMDSFRPVPRTPLPEVDVMTIRRSDIDPIGHVNNAVYLDFLETAVGRLSSEPRKINRLMIQYHKEISGDIPKIRVGIAEENGRFDFTLASETGIHAFGEFTTGQFTENHGSHPG
ncbi:MAG TPA: hypothetical protein DHV36_11570 [Desulfobacteraceae bacterium]|nr:hypothetical protein [Desulfobacteraceae bacterium]